MIIRKGKHDQTQRKRIDGNMRATVPLAPLVPLASLPSTRMIMGTASNMSSTSTNTTTTMASLSMQQTHSQSQPELEPQLQIPTTTIAALEWQYFQAVSLFRRRKYEKCVEVCNGMLRTGHETNVQMFTSSSESDEADAQYSRGAGGSGSLVRSNNNSNNLNLTSGSRQGRSHNQNFKNNNSKHGNTNGNNNKVSMPTWMMEGVWQLKMRALTQRVYIDDLETDDAFEGGKYECALLIAFENCTVAKLYI